MTRCLGGPLLGEVDLTLGWNLGLCHVYTLVNERFEHVNSGMCWVKLQGGEYLGSRVEGVC